MWTYRGPQSLFEWIRDLLEYRRVNVRKRRARRSPLLANEEDEDDTSSQEPHSIHNPKRRRLDGEVSVFLPRLLFSTLNILIRDSSLKFTKMLRSRAVHRK